MNPFKVFQEVKHQYGLTTYIHHSYPNRKSCKVEHLKKGC